MKLDYVYTTYKEQKMGFLFEDMHLTEAHFFCVGNSRAGEICTAMVEKVVPAIDGVFLEGPDKCKLFLHISDSEGKILRLRSRGTRKENELKTGDVVLVQITADAQKNKQYEASFNLSLTGEAVIVNRTGQIGVSKKIKDTERRDELKLLMQKLLEEKDPGHSFGVILRTAALEFSDEFITEETTDIIDKLQSIVAAAETTPEFKMMYRPMAAVEDRIRHLSLSGQYDEIVFHTDLEINDAAFPETVRIMRAGQNSLMTVFNIPVLVGKALERKVFLSDGGYLFIDHTEAMTVIDVNSGKSIKGKDHEERALAENKLAAAEIARQLRLRNISGMILVDFISMKKPGNDRELLTYLKQVTAADSSEVHVVDMTRLGLVEMTRKKKDAPLREKLS